jgi:K+-transporting ATPase KdpF subunit
MSWLATAFEEAAMILDYGLGAAVTLGLLVYLVYALIRPEKF